MDKLLFKNTIAPLITISLFKCLRITMFCQRDGELKSQGTTHSLLSIPERLVPHTQWDIPFPYWAISARLWKLTDWLVFCPYYGVVDRLNSTAIRPRPTTEVPKDKLEKKFSYSFHTVFSFTIKTPI